MTVQKNLENWPEMDDHEACEMECVGNSPWGGDQNPMEVWCWDETANEVLIGKCPEDARIVSYAEARQIFSHFQPIEG